jgi:hypothetical protein
MDLMSILSTAGPMSVSMMIWQTGPHDVGDAGAKNRQGEEGKG